MRRAVAERLDSSGSDLIVVMNQVLVADQILMVLRVYGLSNEIWV
jgi:hypothetical protein